jgi:hypothetical protein
VSAQELAVLWIAPGDEGLKRRGRAADEVHRPLIPAPFAVLCGQDGRHARRERQETDSEKSSSHRPILATVP